MFEEKQEEHVVAEDGVRDRVVESELREKGKFPAQFSVLLYRFCVIS